MAASASGGRRSSWPDGVPVAPMPPTASAVSPSTRGSTSASRSTPSANPARARRVSMRARHLFALRHLARNGQARLERVAQAEDGDLGEGPFRHPAREGALLRRGRRARARRERRAAAELQSIGLGDEDGAGGRDAPKVGGRTGRIGEGGEIDVERGQVVVRLVVHRVGEGRLGGERVATSTRVDHCVDRIDPVADDEHPVDDRVGGPLGDLQLYPLVRLAREREALVGGDRRDRGEGGVRVADVGEDHGGGLRRVGTDSARPQWRSGHRATASRPRGSRCRWWPAGSGRPGRPSRRARLRLRIPASDR